MLCLVEIRGALAQGANLKTDPARRGARLLYEGLKSQYQMIAFSPEDAEITNWWLKKEYMAEWSLIKPWDRDVFAYYHEWIEHEVGIFLASGWEIALYVDTYGEAIERIQAKDVTTMQLHYPAHGPGFYDPEKPPRAWATLAGEPGGTNGPG